MEVNRDYQPYLTTTLPGSDRNSNTEMAVRDRNLHTTNYLSVGRLNLYFDFKILVKHKYIFMETDKYLESYPLISVQKIIDYSFIWIHNNDLVHNLDFFCFCFSQISFTENGKTINRQLKPKGDTVPVTNLNRQGIQ